MKDKANEAGDEVAMGAARQQESASGQQAERLSLLRRRLLAGAAAALATPLLAHAAEGGLSAEGLPPLLPRCASACASRVWAGMRQRHASRWPGARRRWREREP